MQPGCQAASGMFSRRSNTRVRPAPSGHNDPRPQHQQFRALTWLSASAGLWRMTEQQNSDQPAQWTASLASPRTCKLNARELHASRPRRDFPAPRELSRPSLHRSPFFFPTLGKAGISLMSHSPTLYFRVRQNISPSPYCSVLLGDISKPNGCCCNANSATEARVTNPPS